MKKTIYWSLLISILTFAACQDDDVMSNSEPEGAELVSVRAEIGGTDTRAAVATKNVDYIGREKFAGNDVMVLTHFKRTQKPLVNFSYDNVRYVCNSNLAWSRSIQDGFCQSERIYWTDNDSYHTFKGYSIPQAWNSSDDTEKWVRNDEVFTGHFTYRTDSNEKTYIDFRSLESDMKDEYQTNSQGTKVPTGNKIDSTGTRLKNEDLLIVCNTEQLIDKGGMTTTLRYRHALASLRVIIDINGFAPTSTSEDAKTMVSDLVVLKQPWKYQWTQESFSLCAPDNNGQETNPGWGVQDNMGESPKIDSVFTWQPRPDGEGTGKAKKFTFYSLIVPGQQTNFTMNYRVTYPKYNNPEEYWTKTYQAVVPTVNFLPGYTTTLLISLNHKGEPIYIGADYVDWEYVETPDRGELQKISTFLDVNVRDKDGKKVVSIAKDDEATKDDATWLYYIDEVKDDEEQLRDIYGNDGSLDNPFIIKTARQFMSFAYEVKEGMATGGRTFEGKYIKLDSDICLQKSTNISATDTITWNGIGDASNPFKGTFDAGFRIIKGLKGKPLFANNAGTIQYLYLEDIIRIDGNAAFVDTNSGKLIGCSVGTRKFDDPHYTIVGDGTNTYFGSLCSVNSGTITACYSTSSFVVKKASATIGGLVGNNTGKIQVSYAASHVEATTPAAVNGVAGANVEPGTILNCYFDKNENQLVYVTIPDNSTNEQDTFGAIALTTLQMQNESQVTILNEALTQLGVTSYRFYYRTAAYPVIDYGTLSSSN